MKIADIIRTGIAANKTNEEILVDVKNEHPAANTNIACVNWYRSQARKAGGVSAPKKVAAPKKASAVVAVVKKATASVWGVKSVKTFDSPRGIGYTATITFEGNAVASAQDMANGDEATVAWNDRDTTADVTGYDHNNELYTYEGTEMEAAFAAYVLANQGEGFALTPYLHIEDMVNDAVLAKKVKAQMKTKTMFLTADGVLRSAKAVYSEAVVKFISNKYPNSVIINELSIEEAVKALNTANRNANVGF